MWFFFLVILCNELAVKCVIGFPRYMRIMRTNGNAKRKNIIFNVKQNRIVCRHENVLKKRPIGLLDLVV